MEKISQTLESIIIIIILENISQILETKTLLQMEKISQSLESIIIIIILENISQTLETKKQIEKMSETLEALCEKEIKANEMTKSGLEIQIANQTQTIKTFLSDHFKFTWLPTQFKQHSLPSYNFLPLQINHPNNQILLQFDTKTINKDYFIYSNNNQTITYNGVNAWRMIYVNKPLPKNQIISINFRIEKSYHNNAAIMIGICPISILNNTGRCFDNTMGAYAYYGAGSGYIYYNNTYIQLNGAGFSVGSIIRMTVNLLEYTIEWMKDNKMMHRMNLDKSYVNQEMYPCLHLCNKDDSVSLLNN